MIDVKKESHTTGTTLLHSKIKFIIIYTIQGYTGGEIHACK
jgi:hypothetical protein